MARRIAAEANADSTVPSRTVTSYGKEIVFRDVISVREDAPPEKLQQWREMIRGNMIPAICALPGNRIGFSKGMSYVFIYRDQTGRYLDEFSVDKKVCDRLR